MTLKEKAGQLRAHFMLWRYGFTRYTDIYSNGFDAPHSANCRITDEELLQRFSDLDDLEVWCEATVPERYWRIKKPDSLSTMVDTYRKMHYLKVHKDFFSTISGAVSNGHGISLYPDEVRDTPWAQIKNI